MAKLTRYLSRDFVREHPVQIGYVAVGVVLFFVFLAATFPYTEVLSSVLAPTGFTISSQSQGMAFPFGVRMTGVAVTDSAISRSRPILASDELSISPSFLSFLTGSPGINLAAKLYGGDLTLSARRDGGLIVVAFKLSGVQPGRYPELRALGVKFDGRVSATGHLTLSPNQIAADNGTVTFSGSGISIRAIRGMAPVKLGQVQAVADLKHGKLTIRNATTEGGDLLFSGRGSVRLQPSLPDSTLDIKFRLRPSAAAHSRLEFLMGMLPHPPSSTPYLLQGTLAQPNLS